MEHRDQNRRDLIPVVLSQDIRQGQVAFFINQLRQYHSEQQIGKGRAGAVPQTANSIHCAVLRTAHYNAVAQVRTQVGAHHQQHGPLSCGCHNILVACAVFSAADSDYQHNNQVHYHDTYNN